jgi:hypothetical protein
MHARVTTFEGSPEQIEKGVRVYREDVIPWLRDAEGFRGWIVLLDREAGRSIGLTFWTSSEAARDREESGATLRDEVAEAVGASMRSLEIYEVVAAEELALDELG